MIIPNYFQSLSRLPVPPQSQIVGKVGLEPTRLSALVPKTSASTIPPLTHICGGGGIRTHGGCYTSAVFQVTNNSNSDYFLSILYQLQDEGI